MNRNSPSLSHETKMEPILSYPYNAFLMVRLEFAQILQDDLQAKLLRIIEAHIETQRMVLYREAVNKQKGNPIQPISIPKDIYVPISYKLFMNDLFDLVTSENTIKKALNQMINCRIIFRKEAPKKRYAAPEYSINTTVLQNLLNALKNPGYQILIPSIIDALKNSYPQELTPSGYQTLISSILKSSSEEQSRVSKFDTNIRENNITDKNECVPSENSQQGEIFTPSLTPSSLSSSQEIPPQEDVLSAEEKRIASYLDELEFDFDLTDLNKQHLTKLAKKVKSLEQMRSLIEFTKNQEHLKEKTIYLGNLANTNNLNGWKQKQEQSSEVKENNKSEKSVLGVSGLPLCMSNPSEPRLEYRFQRGKSRRRVVAQ